MCVTCPAHLTLLLTAVTVYVVAPHYAVFSILTLLPSSEVHIAALYS